MPMLCTFKDQQYARSITLGPYMTSALRGEIGVGTGWPEHYNSTDRLREWVSDKGVQKSTSFADVI